MKKILTFVISVMFLCGCSSGERNVDRAMALRNSVVSAKSCTFSVEITADYQSEYYNFKMDCNSDDSGNIHFTVSQPETIAGITGEISSDGGKLTFNDKYLVFAPLVDGWITPVSAPWIFMEVLRSGYISGCSNEEGKISVLLNDTYQGETVDVTIGLNENDLPDVIEIFWQGRRVVTMGVENFTIL